MADKFVPRNLKERGGPALTERKVERIVAGATGSNVQEFAASGTWTEPADARRVLVELMGGGGGGARAGPRQPGTIKAAPARRGEGAAGAAGLIALPEPLPLW